MCTEEEYEEGLEQIPSTIYTSDDLIQEYIREIEEKELEDNRCLKK